MIKYKILLIIFRDFNGKVGLVGTVSEEWSGGGFNWRFRSRSFGGGVVEVIFGHVTNEGSA